jgi:hypothetical protein
LSENKLDVFFSARKAIDERWGVVRGEPSSAKFEILMYLGIFFWQQAAL